jgi:hypothetical protein
MSAEPRATQTVHDLILAEAEEGRDRYYGALRRRDIAPTPSEGEGLLFAPNPVVIERGIVRSMAQDLDAFCRARREETPTSEDLIATMPPEFRELFANPEVAAKIHDQLETMPPIALLDGFLREGPAGLEPAYLEWQTFPAYPATAVHALEALHEAYPKLDSVGASFSPQEGESLNGLRTRVRRDLLRGVEDDPRLGVLVDFEPWEQETRFEFRMQIALTGGADRGIGVIDPREICYREGQAHYRRDGQLLPIRSITSRLVPHEAMAKLLPQCSALERENLRRVFADVKLDWRVHPLHFFYGSKADLPRFRAQRLSPYIPACEPVTAEFIAAARRQGLERIEGRVQKPVDGHGGRDVRLDPAIDELEVGALLQDRIRPAAWHPSLDGPRIPEVRLMAIPDAAQPGRLAPFGVFTRVMGPQEFRSNAGAIAHRNLPGTGEGYALFVN